MAGNIKGITIEINGDTTKLDKALRDVNKETKTVQRQLSEVERALKLNPGNTDLIKQKQRLLGEELDSTKQKLEYLKQADEKTSEEMKNGTEGATEKHKELQRQIAVTEAKEKMLQKQLDKLSAVPSKIDKISAGFEKAGKKISAVSKKVEDVGKGLTTGVTVPLVGVGAASMKAWSEVDAGMDIVIEKTGASGKQLEEMQKSVESLTTSIPTDFETAGAAIGEVNTRFGVTGKQLEDLSGAFIKFSELNDTDVSDSIDSVQKALSAFGLSAEDAEGLLDTLNATGQKTGASVDTLTNGLVQNATAFQEMGLDIHQATIFMGQMETSGANSETVMQGLRKALKKAAEDGIPLNEALADLQDSILNGTDDMDGLTKAYELFGKSGDQIYGAVKNGTLDFNALAAAADDAGGSVADTFEGTLDPADEMKMTLNQLKLTGAALGSTIFKMLLPYVQKAGEFMEKVKQKWDALSPKTQDMIVKIGLIAAAIGPMLVMVAKVGGAIGTLTGGIGKAIKIGGSLSKAFSGIGGMAGIMGKAIGFLTSPIGLVILAIGAAIAIGVLLYKNWDKIKAVAIKVFSAIKNVITTMMNTIKKVITTVWNAIKTFFVTIFNAIKTAVTAYFKAYYTVIKTIVTAISTIVNKIWNGIKTAITTVVKAIKTVVTNAWNGIKSVTSSVFNGIKSIARSIWNGVKTAIMTPVNAVKSALSSAWSSIKSTASSVWNGIKSAMTRPIESAKNLIKGIIDKIKGFFHFSVSLPHIKLPHFSISPSGWKIGDLLKGSIPKLGISWYAKGGIFNSPSLIGIGESGPEAVLPIEKLQNMIDAGNAKLLNALVSISSNPGAGENTSLADEIVAALGRATVPIVLEVDGKTIAKVTAPFINKELSAIDRRYNRKLGTI